MSCFSTMQNYLQPKWKCGPGPGGRYGSQAWGIESLRPSWQGKIFCNLQGAASSNSALLSLYSQDKNLASISIAFPDVIFYNFFDPFSLFSAQSIVSLNTTINVHKSCRGHFPFNHRGNFWKGDDTLAARPQSTKPILLTAFWYKSIDKK